MAAIFRWFLRSEKKDYRDYRGIKGNTKYAVKRGR